MRISPYSLRLVFGGKLCPSCWCGGVCGGSPLCRWHTGEPLERGVGAREARQQRRKRSRISWYFLYSAVTCQKQSDVRWTPLAGDCKPFPDLPCTALWKKFLICLSAKDHMESGHLLFCLIPLLGPDMQRWLTLYFPLIYLNDWHYWTFIFSINIKLTLNLIPSVFFRGKKITVLFSGKDSSSFTLKVPIHCHFPCGVL